MAKIDSNTSVAVVLTGEELERMLEALQNLSDPDAWIRLVASTDSEMPDANEIVCYVQGPDGYESIVFLD